MNVEEINPEELKFGLIKDPKKRADVQTRQYKEQSESEYKMYNKLIEVLEKQGQIAFNDPTQTKEYKDIQFVIQKEQLGTADACFAAYDKIKDNYGNTLIIPGDMPLIKEEVIKELYLYHLSSSNKLTVLSTSVNNPKGYGRIYRENESVKKIIEESDATPKEKSIKEINTGVYLVDNQLLFEALKLINSNNNQHEFYLTDIVEIINNKYLVGAYLVPYSFHLIGVNDYETLNYVEKCLNDSI
jgi:bifunctional UDP-N-acetylglucosamine pyrophosphorylase/glucosamine-1-phosphate N-acetyltransferase